MRAAVVNVLITLLWLLASAAWPSAPVQEVPPSEVNPAALRQSIQIVTTPGRYVSFRYQLTGADGTVYNRPPGRERLGTPTFTLYKGNRAARSGRFGFS